MNKRIAKHILFGILIFTMVGMVVMGVPVMVRHVEAERARNQAVYAAKWANLPPYWQHAVYIMDQIGDRDDKLKALGEYLDRTPTNVKITPGQAEYFFYEKISGDSNRTILLTQTLACHIDFDKSEEQ